MSITEQAYLRTLRDIADGHLHLWINAQWFDTATGEPLAAPIVCDVHPDRSPAVGVPIPVDGQWWKPMVRRGWLAVHVVAGRTYYRVTDAGSIALQGLARERGEKEQP